MADIEKIIKNNRAALDSDEPADGHFERFEEKLKSFHKEKVDSETKVTPLFYRSWMKIAVAVVILIGFGFILFNIGYHNGSNRLASDNNEIMLSPELEQVEFYYSSMADERLADIDDLVSDSLETMKIKEMVHIELSELKHNYGELLEEYKKNPDDERIIDAIINNYRIRADILDNIINKLNELKNPENENEENESISL